MGVDIVRPSVCDLIFQLYGRPVHPELFDILAVRKLQHADYQLTVWITRTDSDAVSLPVGASTRLDW